ncbi:hypothetical protein LTR53_013155, partial [Teratosphaeriaceae sp. CCFEE 6253]
MTSHVPMARVPFAPLDSPRLQHLASAKNRQNGIISSKSVLGSKMGSFPTKTSPKRPLEIPTFDDPNSENVDPVHLLTSPSKKSKGEGDVVKPFAFALNPSNTHMMAPPPTVPARLLSTPLRANISSPRAPLTAPAGRSPKRKIPGIDKHRRISAPFTRIDPPFPSSSSS